MAIRLRLPIPYHKASRLILPCGLLLAGMVIFLCGLVRTFHVDKVETKTAIEERYLTTQNEYVEWWAAFPLILSASLAITAVILDKPLLFKLSVLAIGTCFVLLIYALIWDAGEFSRHARNMNYVRLLKGEGYNCKTLRSVYNNTRHVYIFHECKCTYNGKASFLFFAYISCELLHSLYYLHAVLGFALSCAIGLSLFTLFSFVLILKRISQITTALHLDEKPLSEDFGNLHGDLYVES